MTTRTKIYSLIKIVFASVGVCIFVFSLGHTSVKASSNSLSGRILLQVNQNGEAWYINPVNQKRYFMGRPDDAFSLMRELGLGISETNFNKFKNNNNTAPVNLAGKIILRVENNGEAYYVYPLDLKMHYLGRPADAFQVMRELGLGITDTDLGKIEVERGVEKIDDKSKEVVQAEVKQLVETGKPAREARTYIGSGTYDFGEGDVLIDSINNMKFVQSGLYEEHGSQWLTFNIYDISTGAPISNRIQLYLEPDRLYTGYDSMRMVYSYHEGKLPLYFFTFKGKNPDDTYKVSFDFYLDDVLGDKAVGNKKILIVPVYFDDEYEVFDQFSLYRETFLNPALKEVQAYLKVKQIEFMGEEIMTADFTVAEAIKLGKSRDYLPNETGDNYQTRKKMVRDNTKYNPDDFDVLAFMFFTEQYSMNTARFNQAMITSHQSRITDLELNTPVLKHQLRNTITNGLLHEILHIYGMSDINGGMKFLFYESELYDGSQELKNERRQDYSIYEQTGIFQMIDEVIAHEIGWRDENSNGIFDANEYYINQEE